MPWFIWIVIVPLILTAAWGLLVLWIGDEHDPDVPFGEY